MFAEAERALSEFGGLEVNQEGEGKTCAREPFVLIPTVGTGAKYNFDEFSEHIGMRLYPLGEAAGGNYFLAIGETGQVFFLMHHIRLLGQNIEEALENLIRGISLHGHRQRPGLRINFRVVHRDLVGQYIGFASGEPLNHDCALIRIGHIKAKRARQRGQLVESPT